MSDKQTLLRHVIIGVTIIFTVTDILEFLNTQAAMSDAKQERIRCQDEWRSAWLRLLASVELLGRETVSP